jgi:hypothetical protein
MKRILPIIAVIMLAAYAAKAEPKWSGAGWYQTVQVSGEGRSTFKFILKGPFADESTCLAGMHPDYTTPGYDEGDPSTFHDYSCENLTSRPDWDV